MSTVAVHEEQLSWTNAVILTPHAKQARHAERVATVCVNNR